MEERNTLRLQAICNIIFGADRNFCSQEARKVTASKTPFNAQEEIKTGLLQYENRFIIA